MTLFVDPTVDMLSDHSTCSIPLSDMDGNAATSHKLIAPPTPRRNVFTVSYASSSPACLTTALHDSTKPESDASFRRAQDELDVRTHKAKLHDEFIAKCEAAAEMGEKDRRIAVRLLLYTAAHRNVREAVKCGYAEPVVHFMRDTWSAFLHQAKEFLVQDDNQSNAMTNSTVGRAAIENISSIGIWFAGNTISLPLRQYAIQIAAPDGTMQSVIVVGLLSFAYSSYVMQLRTAAQQNTLAELARSQEQLGTNWMFVPRFVVAPTL